MSNTHTQTHAHRHTLTRDASRIHVCQEQQKYKKIIMERETVNPKEKSSKILI